jgi:hypothetical protein
MRKLLFLTAAVALAQRPARTLVITETQLSNEDRINKFYDEHIAYIVPLLKAGKSSRPGRRRTVAASFCSRRRSGPRSKRS